MIIFENPGTMDTRAFRTFGLSAKETDNPIGMFGTGLKYAISVMIREQLGITIITGRKQYKFTTMKGEFRDQEYDALMCQVFAVDDGEVSEDMLECFELPYTTDFGKNWDTWQVYREIASNCIDEGGTIDRRFTDDYLDPLELTEALKFDPDKTYVLAELDNIKHSDVFRTADTLVYANTKVHVYEGETNYIYYRGIRVMECDKPCRYTYDMQDAALTEDRTLANMFSWSIGVCEFVGQCPDEHVVGLMVNRSSEYQESKLDFDFLQHASMGPSFVSYMNKNPLPTEHSNSSAYRLINQYNESRSKIVEREPSLRESRLIEQGLGLLKEIGYEVTEPVKVAETLGGDLLGHADIKTQTIWLDPKCFMEPVRDIYATILEEHIHLSKGFEDCTYPMQTWLFNELVRQGAERVGVDV